MDRDVIEQAAHAYCDARSAWARAYTVLHGMRPGTPGFDELKRRTETLEGAMLDRADALAELVIGKKKGASLHPFSTIPTL